MCSMSVSFFLLRIYLEPSGKKKKKKSDTGSKVSCISEIVNQVDRNHCLEASVYKWGGTHSGNTELKRLFLLHFVFLQLGLQVDEMYKMGSTSTALSSEDMKVTTLSAWLLR